MTIARPSLKTRLLKNSLEHGLEGFLQAVLSRAIRYDDPPLLNLKIRLLKAKVIETLRLLLLLLLLLFLLLFSN